MINGIVYGLTNYPVLLGSNLPFTIHLLLSWDGKPSPAYFKNKNYPGNALAYQWPIGNGMVQA